MTDLHIQSGEQLSSAGTGVSIPEPAVVRVGEEPHEVSHTQNVESLTGFYNQHQIVNGTYPWSTNDTVGKVLFVLPNHPDSCNWLTSYVYKIHLAWTGHFEISARILGTAFMGGSLAFALIPPTYTRAQILGMSREQLSIFDFFEIDPKSMEGNTFSTKDFRTTHFHTGSLNEEDPTSFGGWICCMVWGKLNVSPNTDGASLDILVLTKGSYEFRQPRPIISSGPSPSTGPLVDSLSELRFQYGCDDGGGIEGGNCIFVAADTDREICNGDIFAVNPRGTGDKWILNAMENPGMDGTRWGYWQNEVLPTIRRHRNEPEPVLIWSCLSNQQGPGIDERWLIFNSQNNMPPFNCIFSENHAWKGDTYHGTNQSSALSNPQFTTPWGVEFSAAGLSTTPSYQIFAPNAGAGNCAFNMQWKVHKSVVVLRPDEVLVGFTNYQHSTLNAQTSALSRDLKNFSDWPAATSAILTVNDASDTVLLYVRISSQGYLTTRKSGAGSALVTSGLGLRFRFVQWLADNSQMPENPSTLYLKQMAKLRADDAQVVSSLKSELALLRKSVRALTIGASSTGGK